MSLERGLPPAVNNGIFHMGQEGIDKPQILRCLCNALTTLHERAFDALIILGFFLHHLFS